MNKETLKPNPELVEKENKAPDYPWSFRPRFSEVED
jgi:hypothetical protein